MPWGVAAAAGGAIIGGYMQGESAKSAAEKSAQAQLESARIGADASKAGAEAARFTPVGITSRFGKSDYMYDDAGRLTDAGYQLSPEMQSQQDYMMQMANRGLDQYGMGQQYAQPMLQGSQDMMGLGQQYLSSSPQEQAQKYMANQQALLNPSRMAELSRVRQDQFNTGRTGLAVGGDGGMMASNPEIAAYYNSIAQQDAQLAAQAEQHGQDYSKFGASMMGLGGDMLGGYYGAQVKSMQPYQQAMDASRQIEAMGQGTMDAGSALGARTSTAGDTQGQMLQAGGVGAAQAMQQANSYSPWADALKTVSNAAAPYAMNAAFGQPSYRFSPSQGGYQNSRTGEVIYPGGTTAFNTK